MACAAKMQKNDCGVYVSGFETIRVEEKGCCLKIEIGFNGTKWGWAASFFGQAEGWGEPLMDRCMIHPTRNDAVYDAVETTIAKIESMGLNRRYKAVIEELEKRHEPQQIDLFEGVMYG